MDCPSSNLVGRFLDKTNPDCIPVLIAFVSENKSIVDADYERVISSMEDRTFFEIEPTESENLSLLAHRVRLNGWFYLPAVLGVSFAALFFMVMYSRQRDDAI